MTDPNELDAALRKGGVVWVGGEQPRWFAWSARRLLLVTGPGEQPDAGLIDGRPARVVCRSRDTHARAAEFEASVRRLRPTDAEWTEIATTLAGARLNLTDAQASIARWSDPSFAVWVLEPQLPLVGHA